MVEGAALEMLCGETHLGFESLTLRDQKKPETSAVSGFLCALLLRHEEYILCAGEAHQAGRGEKSSEREM